MKHIEQQCQAVVTLTQQLENVAVCHTSVKAFIMFMIECRGMLVVLHGLVEGVHSLVNIRDNQHSKQQLTTLLFRKAFQ